MYYTNEDIEIITGIDKNNSISVITKIQPTVLGYKTHNNEVGKNPVIVLSLDL